MTCPGTHSSFYSAQWGSPMARLHGFGLTSVYWNQELRRCLSPSLDLWPLPGQSGHLEGRNCVFACRLAALPSEEYDFPRFQELPRPELCLSCQDWEFRP